MRRLLVVWLVALLGGCAGVLPPQVERPASRMLVAPADAPLAQAARDAGTAADETGVWPLLQANFALDARLALIENATTSLDLQYYLIADDSTGRPLLRALRDAAARGVRVRLLVDDLYTTDLDRLLLGLAATANIEVRLFNPFVTERGSSARRLLALALDFKRLNHRMHNKLFVADGVMAIVGGRNLADEYFLRGTQNNFLDFDVALTGSAVVELGHWFNLYWNSTAAYPVQAIARAAGRAPAPPGVDRAVFDEATRADPRPDVPMAPDFFGAPAFSTGLAQRTLQFIATRSHALADPPGKIAPARNGVATVDTLSRRFLQDLGEARSDVLLFSPYFIPGPDVLARIGQLRAAGVRVGVVTNSLAVSDEPLVNLGMERHQTGLLQIGVELYQLSSNRLKLDRTLKGLLGASTGRLHAKIGVLDHRTVMVGSMNLDPRSASINTEIGVRIESPRLAEMVLTAFRVDSLTGLYQVRLRPDGNGVRWVSVDPYSPEELDVDPDTSLWLRVRLMLLSLLVPESQL